MSSKVFIPAIVVVLLSSSFQIGEKVVSATAAVNNAYKEISTQKGYDQADALAASKYGWMNPAFMGAIREKESGKDGIYLSKEGGGDPIRRSKPNLNEDQKACWGGDGLPANGKGSWAFSQYQIDMLAHCAWYTSNPKLIEDLNSSNEEARQAAMNKFAEKSAEVLNNCHAGIINSGLFTAEETVPAVANCYNQGLGGVLAARKKGRPLGSGTTTKDGKYYHVEFMEIYNRKKAGGK